MEELMQIIAGTTKKSQHKWIMSVDSVSLKQK